MCQRQRLPRRCLHSGARAGGNGDFAESGFTSCTVCFLATPLLVGLGLSHLVVSFDYSMIQGVSGMVYL